MIPRGVDQIVKFVIADTCAVWNVLASRALHRACIAAGFEFALTDFVLYECLHKPRKTNSDAAERLRERLKVARRDNQFRNVGLSVEDLQAVGQLESRKRLSKGELSGIAFAMRAAVGFQTDDQGARKLATAVLSAERVQTTPHVLGWLFFQGRLVDSDLAGIIEEHEAHERPLRPHYETMYEEAMRCRLLVRQTATGRP